MNGFLDETSVFVTHQYHIASKFGVFVDDHVVFMSYRLPQLHKGHNKSRFIANSSLCTAIVVYTFNLCDYLYF